MARYKNVEWNIESVTWQSAQLAVLMDVRDELQRLNGIMTSYPCAVGLLRDIERHLNAQRRCPHHPRYTGRQKPRVSCSRCHAFYQAVWK